MKKMSVLLASIAMSLLSAGAPVKAQENPGVAIGASVVAKGTVLAVDKENRIVTVRGSEGNEVEIPVGEEAHNFDQIAVGDELTIEAFESVALFVGNRWGSGGSGRRSGHCQVGKRSKAGRDRGWGRRSERHGCRYRQGRTLC